MAQPTTNNRRPTTKMRIGIWFLSLVVSGLLLVSAQSAQAQEIDFLIQGTSHTPPFYKGRTLWTRQTQIVIMAIPHIPGVANPSSLNYLWTKNSTVLGTVSGAGRNSLTFADSAIGRPQTVKLEILAHNGSLLASATTRVTPGLQDLLIYEDSPLYGFIFHREASAGYSLQGQEVTFAAFPLFFSFINRFDPGAQYSWRTNTGETETRSSVTYRVPEGASGSSRINIRVESRDKVMQSASRGFLVEFGQ